MARMSDVVTSNVDTQLVAADAFAGRCEFQRCFEYLERAHILAQTSTYQHVRVHWLMLRWAIGQRDVPECLGQIVRIVGAASKTALGLVPIGNTGGSNVSAFRSMPVPADLAVLLPPRRSRGAVLTTIVVIAGLLLVASAVLGIGTPASAQTALVNGRPMTFRVVGSGRPAVVFISGLGDGMATFDQVATELGKNATVITYDRAGYGGSQAVREPRDARDAERDLFSLLAQSGVPGPYVLVGHSLGGLYAEYYASKHPTQVAGLILEESRPAGFTHRCERLPSKPMCNAPAWLTWMMPGGTRYELEGLAQVTEQVSQSGPLTGRPVLVLSRSRGKERSSFDELWAVAQNDLAARYPGSEHLIAPGDGHYIHRDCMAWFLASIHEFTVKLK